MKSKFWLAILLAALPLSPAAAKPSDWLPWNWGGGDARERGEGPSVRMAAPDLPGFVVGHQAANRNQSIREDVPRGESVQRWTRMVTTQWFRNLGQRLTPTQYAEKMLQDLPRACPGATSAPVQSLNVSGYKAARIKVVCPNTANGRSESFFLLAVSAEDDMFVKQVAFRGEAGSDDFLWARKFLSAVVMCKPGSKHYLCF